MIRYVVGPLLVAQACAAAPTRSAAIDPSNPDAPESAPLQISTGAADPAAAPSASMGAETPSDQPSPAATYTCPMHPEVTSDHPGNCPKCGMKLVPKEKNQQAPSQSKANESNATAPKQPADASPSAQYSCPMHPEVVSDHAGNCPKCGMKLVPRAEQPKQNGHAGHEH